MTDTTRDVVIVGSGAGGATLARSLAEAGTDVLVLETGTRHESVGRFRDAVQYYDSTGILKQPARSEEGVILFRTLMAGGSTVVSAGNGIRALESELEAFGIDLGPDLEAVEADLDVRPWNLDYLSSGSTRLRETAADRGIEFAPMPKFLDQERCRECTQCTLGCRADAKWTALDPLDAAADAGAEIRYETPVTAVEFEGDRATGVRAVTRRQPTSIEADTVVLAAGALGTPAILQRSGMEAAGSGLFVDLFVNTYGVTRDRNMLNEPQMSLLADQFHDEEGFILSPYVNVPREVRYMEAGFRGARLPIARTVGLMTKISDEPVGQVFANGRVSKAPTERDDTRLRTGIDLARELLQDVGADPTSIVESTHQGAHPGGTAAIGDIVDTDLRTEYENLYVCDASVLPEPPGAPPILTIVALARRLGRHLRAR
jgi:choline dehydrogenase-like flavoprotein